MQERKPRHIKGRSKEDQLVIDKMIVKDCKRQLTSWAVAWTDYRKAYNMVLHS